MVISIDFNYTIVRQLFNDLSACLLFYVDFQQGEKIFFPAMYPIFSTDNDNFFFVKKLTNDLLTPVLSLAPQIELSKMINPPYGMNVMLPAYITFLEPTIASFILFHLIRKEISSFSTLIKGLIIAGILIVIHGGIYSILQIICSNGSILYRVFYYGQFVWEYLVLGILTAYSFKWTNPKIYFINSETRMKLNLMQIKSIEKRLPISRDREIVLVDLEKILSPQKSAPYIVPQDGTQFNVYCINEKYDILWQIAPDTGFYTGPDSFVYLVRSDNFIFAGTYGGNKYQIDSETGHAKFIAFTK